MLHALRSVSRYAELKAKLRLCKTKQNGMLINKMNVGEKDECIFLIYKSGDLFFTRRSETLRRAQKPIFSNLETRSAAGLLSSLNIIPLGMKRSVERAYNLILHSIRNATCKLQKDAFLQNAGVRPDNIFYQTIFPNGNKIQNLTALRSAGR
jgi:hypothetical protein